MTLGVSVCTRVCPPARAMEDTLEHSDKFKQIFDLCDVDKDGFIDVQHFTELAQDHFGAYGTEELTGIINLLDPEGRGLISYADFCEGIQQIIEIQQQAARTFKSSVSQETLVSEDTLVPLDIAGDLSVLETHKPNSTSSSQYTFAEYDLSGFDDFSGIGLNLNGSTHQSNIILPQTELNGNPFLLPHLSEDEGDSAISGKSSEINENSRQEITDEENYEDYGEIESEADVSDQGHLTPSTQRKRSDRKDPLSRHHKKSPNRRITSAALASQLQRSARNSPSSTRRSSFGSDEIFDDIEGNFQSVDGRLKFLEDQLQHLTQVQTETNTKQIKLKDENNILVQKVIYLEEQLRDMEVKSEDRLSEERRKYQEFMSKQERDKNEQVDYITQRLHRIEQEYETLKQEAPRLHAEIAKLRTEKMDIQERLLERQETYNILYDDHEKLKADYHKQEVLHQKERHSTGQLLDEMGKELEELRRYRIDMENGARSPSGSISELPGRYRDLQNEIHKLKEAMWSEWKDLWKENRHLHDSNEELNAQLLNQCIGEGKSLLGNTEGQSLAQELEHLTKEELLAQLKLERDVNFRLKQYVDHIIITILEKNPSLLDITHR
ncbi:rab11 family-interacting protein 4B-like isoform X2 [Physella acuta]|uniref:rab11 family-interacting protein 4B-like isoform X2 n=1 Tax=Physella acuta TaxID=109671 RepID=UPI0027DC2187|nr:rab11 family-interacting protein 4B-like isoform X2 [Physella acuta]